jgi:hypothetical protein
MKKALAVLLIVYAAITGYQGLAAAKAVKAMAVKIERVSHE